MRSRRIPERHAAFAAALTVCFLTVVLSVLPAYASAGGSGSTSPRARPAAATAGAHPSQEPTATTLVARVTDESGAVVPDHEVVVLIIDAERQIAEELRATTSSKGEARFEGVLVEPGYSAWATTIYETASYQGEPVSLTPGVDATLPLPVFTVSDVPTNLHIEMLHVILNTIEPGLYQAVQVMSVLNPGDRAGYSSGQHEGRRVGMTIPVPVGATAVGPIPQFSGLDPANLVVVDGALLDLRPVPPGTQQIAVQYEVVTDAEGSELALTLPYPTAEVSMLVGPGLGTTVVESEQLNELEPVSIPNQGDFANYRSDVFAAGDTLSFHVGPPAAPMSIGAWALLALAGALFAGAVVSLWSGRRRPATQPAGPPPEDRQGLIAAVARLDDQFAAGGLDEADYQAQRADVIARIVAIDKRTAGAPGSHGA